MEDLNDDPTGLDPLKDRVMKNVPVIARWPLTREKLWHVPKNSNDGLEVPNLAVIRAHLLKEGHLNKPEIIEIITKATKIWKNEPNVIKMREPVIIVGDVHG